MTPFVRILLVGSVAVASPLIAKRQQPPAAAAEAGPAQSPSFVPPGFNPPTRVKAARFQLVPLGPALVKIDFDAYMSSIDHLQKTFTRGADWPRKDITQADARRDMENEQARFRNRKSFAYAVLTPDGSRERGSVYVSPSPVGAYDAVVRLWVTKDEHDKSFDAELYAWVVGWMKSDWPLRSVAFPGRSIDWRTWDSIVAAGAQKAARGTAKTP